jgi:hypothetical protein
MENNIQNKSFLEIPLTPCSNIHLFKQLHLFISQNNLPIDITTSKSTSTSITRSRSIQTGGGDLFVYQEAYTPYTLFSNFMDKLFLQKRQDNIQDTENKKVLESMFSKDKTKEQILQSLETISDQKKKEDAKKEDAKKEEETKPKTPPKEEPKTEKPKIIIKPIEETNKLYMHIQTNHPNPIDAIKGTKLYYLYQRQQENLCAHLV